MDREHEADIIQTLTPYLLAFPQSKMTTEGLLVYARALSGLSIAEINAAMLKLMRTCKFFPTVAEIFEQAAVMKEFACGSGLPTPEEAWAEAQKNVRTKHLYGGEWEYSCPEVKRAVDSFGKVELCSLDVDEVNTARAQFMRIYKSIVEQARDRKSNAEVMNLLPQGHVQELIGTVAKKLSMGV
jgi:hypothetical protein